MVRLKNNWNSDIINDGSNHSTYTSFTTDKRDFTMCLRSLTTNKLEPESLMMFVFLHEAAHCATEYSNSPSEDPPHHRVLGQLQVCARGRRRRGFTSKQDFWARPVKFCDVDVTDSPLH